MPTMKSSYTAAQTAMTKAAPAQEQPPAIKVHKAYLDTRLTQIGKWVTQGVKPEALVRFALSDMSTNAALAKCTPESIYLGLLACAVTGLEPGALKGEAYLVPFAGKAQFMPGWKGLVKQARRSRDIAGISAQVVRHRDVFDLDLGTANSLVHKPALADRGDVIGAYAIAKMTNGHNEIEWVDLEDLQAIAKVAQSRGKSRAWADWEDQMQRKSAIRRLCTRLPLGADYYVAMALEEAEGAQAQRQVLDLETDGEATRAELAAGTSQEMLEQAGPTPEEIAAIQALEAGR